MDTITLLRFAEHGTWGTWGTFLDPENIPICVSLELPWRENQRNISCIPEGKYVCIPEQSKAFKSVIYRLQNVPERDGILIHPANNADQIEGCIVPGASFDYVRGKPGVASSGAALAEIRKTVRAQPFMLSIIRANW